ncbi:MAG TPA: hypothetical protein VGQ51_10050 [Puia sp.]|jgi:hypothetical protein|nr:hypothetical protein [Puia sp.]
MRSAIVQLFLVLVGISGIHAVRLLQTSSFHVRLFPANGAGRVWAIQGKDSIEMTNVNGEYILRSVKPGNWEVSVQANGPYRSACFQSGDLKPGMDRDLGEIRLIR